MSLGIPLITFASGGVGEYVDAPHKHIVLNHNSLAENLLLEMCPNQTRTSDGQHELPDIESQTEVLNFLISDPAMHDTWVRVNETLTGLISLRCKSIEGLAGKVAIEIDVSNKKVTTVRSNDQFDLTPHLPFALSGNAVVVQSPRVEAIAQAVVTFHLFITDFVILILYCYDFPRQAFLESSTNVRKRLSGSGLQTVQSFFLMQKTVGAYRALLWRAAVESREQKLLFEI